MRARLGGLRRRLRGELVLEFLAEALAAAVALAALLVLLYWWYRPGLAARLVLLGLGVLGLLGWLGRGVARRWRSARLDVLSLAIVLDRHRPGLGQQVADVLQLPDLVESDASSSPALIALAVRRAGEALAAADWRSLWNRRRTAAFGALLATAAIVPPAFALVAPEAARLSLARWLLGSRERWPQRTYLSVVGVDNRGRLLAPRDERFAVEVRSDPPPVALPNGWWTIAGRGEPLKLRTRPSASMSPPEVTLVERAADGSKRTVAMAPSGPGRFRHEFSPASKDSTFELAGGDDWLGPIRVERVDRPSLADIKMKVKEPGATYQGFRTVADPRQNLVVLPDTEVELKLVGNEPIDNLEVNVHPGNRFGVDRVADRSFSARWVLREATTLEVVLTSRATGLSSTPSFLSIGLLRDREPRVTLRAAGVGGHVTPTATIPLSLGATDDLGLAAIRIVDERTSTEGEARTPKAEKATIAIPLALDPSRPALDHQARHDVDLAARPPKVGTLLRFVAEADDRCARGKQTGRSGALQLQVVSPDELFYEILVRQRAERAKFLAALESIEKQTPVLAGSTAPESAQGVVRTYLTTSRQLDQIAGRIADTLQEMTLNQVGSPKSHRLLQEGVVEPIRALTAPEGPMARLRAALHKGNGDRDAARTTHAEVASKMKTILEQMSQWESFVDVVNQVAEVIKMQQDVLKATEKAAESRTREIFDDKP